MPTVASPLLLSVFEYAPSHPFGPEEWANRTAKRLGLAATLRPLGRPAHTRD